MFYIGITIKGGTVKGGTEYLNNTGLYFENGIIYARKGTTAESLLIPSRELETIKGHIRRLPLDIYQQLNDDFGVHEHQSRMRPIIKKRV